MKLIWINTRYTSEWVEEEDADPESSVWDGHSSLALVEDKDLGRARIPYENYMKNLGIDEEMTFHYANYDGPVPGFIFVLDNDQSLVESAREGTIFPRAERTRDEHNYYFLGEARLLPPEVLEHELYYTYEVDRTFSGVMLQPFLPLRGLDNRGYNIVAANSFKEALKNVFEIQRTKPEGRGEIRI